MKNPDIRHHFKPKDIIDFSIKILIKCGYSDNYAKATSYALVEADKRGIFSHGMAGGTGLEECVKESGAIGKVDVQAEPEIIDQKYPSIMAINANGAPGHITSFMAANLVKDIARRQGLGKVFVYNGNHFGAAGIWSTKISEEKDLEGVVTCTTVACVKPMGDDPSGIDYTIGAGKEVRIGTNPLAISVPHSGGIMTLDMSLARMAASYCVKCYKSHEMMKIPEYVADDNYKTTLDPKKYMEEAGSIFPLGSTSAGYKGDSLLRMIEIDNSIGGGPIKKVDIKSTERKNISHTFYAQAIDFLYTRDNALDRVSSLMADYQNNYFGAATRWPGDRSLKALEYAEKEGIPYSAGQIETLQRTASYVGLDFQKCVQPISQKGYPVDLFKK